MVMLAVDDVNVISNLPGVSVGPLVISKRRDKNDQGEWLYASLLQFQVHNDSASNILHTDVTLTAYDADKNIITGEGGYANSCYIFALNAGDKQSLEFLLDDLSKAVRAELTVTKNKVYESIESIWRFGMVA